jgi:hypothetical protein
MTTLRQAAEMALEALVLAHDFAQAAAADYHESMKGYRPHRHAQMDADVKQIADAAEALRAALAEQPEPVAWMTPGQDLHLHNPEGFRFSDWTPLYSAPPQRVPLTEEQLLRIARDEAMGTSIKLTRDVGPYEVTEPTYVYKQIARAIERAHGITGVQT